MVRRVFLKLWLALTAILLAFAVAALIFIRVEAYPATESTFQLGWPVFITFLVAWGLVTLLCLLTARRFSRSEAATIQFAGRLASGQFDVSIDRREAGDANTIEALNGASASLGQMYRALETSRRELTALLDSMEEAVIAISPDGQVSWSNAVFEDISQSPVRYGRALVHTIRDPDVLDAVERALRDREVCKGRATSVAAGRVFQVNVAPTPGGGAVLVLHDVTKVEQAEVSRRDFVANVSHELRTPLTSISGYVETLIESHGLREEQTKEFLSVILKNASRMHRLTEDLLALARVESKDYSLTPQASPASVLVVDAIESLAPLAIDAGLDLLPGSMVEDQVMADPDALQQVFGNLIENAIKYGKQGGRIVVGCRRVGENVEFFVQDYGAGIASHHLSRLFERFYRVDTARSRESGGTGLGLAIVKRILEAHRGDIWVESELGQGTAFLFRLPAIEHARDAERAAETIPDVIAPQRTPPTDTQPLQKPGLENVAATGPHSA